MSEPLPRAPEHMVQRNGEVFLYGPKGGIAMTWLIERVLRLKLAASITEEITVTREQRIDELRTFLAEIAEPVEC